MTGAPQSAGGHIRPQEHKRTENLGGSALEPDGWKRSGV